MRTEAEMLALIQCVALADERIRAAYIEGSRVNPNAPRDIFQDYDVVYVVTTTTPFREDRSWIRRFGDILYMQYPEENVFYPADVENCYGWQVQFMDGNRLDLHVCSASYALKNLELYRILVDKDGLLPQPQECSDARYWVARPDEAAFASTCSDFWWCTNNVAKGLWRQEIPYAMEVLDGVLRPQLMRMLSWMVGEKTRFSVSVGKAGKYLKRYLPKETYARFLATYPRAKTEEIWNSVFEMCSLFHASALTIAEKEGFFYDTAQAENSLHFLRCVRALPEDATDIVITPKP